MMDWNLAAAWGQVKRVSTWRRPFLPMRRALAVSLSKSMSASAKASVSPGGYQQGSFAVRHGLGDAADGGGYDGLAEAVRLEQRDREAFAVGGHGEQRALLVQVVLFRARYRPQEGNGVAGGDSSARRLSVAA